MTEAPQHTFHIPVLGLGYSIDTPVKVARYGISSVVSIIEDELLEKMREFYCTKSGEEYIPITVKENDYRASRITAYLNLLNRIVNQQVEELSILTFDSTDINKYFEILPDNSDAKKLYAEMLKLPPGEEKLALQEQLRAYIKAGAIDVNIMSKIDNNNYASDGSPLPPEFSDALSALRGYAKSDLTSSVVFSAGYNPRLYNYLENFDDFFPDSNGQLKKKVILKVSDYRSALIQGKILAKKGIWVSEFRIESGLNCGGHAFPTEGVLLGPILEEFKQKRAGLANELFEICTQAHRASEKNSFPGQPPLKITVQGGIGTSSEHDFLIEYYGMDATGWGSPFLLVPEATNVDEHTLNQLATAKKDDYFLSEASPLGVPFHNFRHSTSEQQRKERIAKGRPGSPCYKKFLSSDTEFTTQPICTASRQYQDLKIKQLDEKGLTAEEFATELASIAEKDCLCEGLGVSALLKNDISPAHKLTAVVICPGPNLAYFSGTFTLREMVDHIYGRINILNTLPRPNMFINEAQLYMDYLQKQLRKNTEVFNDKRNKYLASFRSNLLKGLEYYKTLVPLFKKETPLYRELFDKQLTQLQVKLDKLVMELV